MPQSDRHSDLRQLTVPKNGALGALLVFVVFPLGVSTLGILAFIIATVLNAFTG
jgi:hypothetical protein